MAAKPFWRASHRGSSILFAVVLLFCFFCSTAQAASAVLGIDFGTEYIKATLVKPGVPLDIVLTKDSRRKETAAVAFKPDKSSQSGGFPERIYGSDAVALAARFPGDVYLNLKALLGLPATNSKVEEYAAQHPALKIEGDKTRKTVAFRSGAFGDDEEPWLVEEILAMELQSIKRNADAVAGKGSSVKDVVITIPPYFSLEERKSIELAADLAGLRVLSLISDGLAVGLNYATSRTFPSVTQGGKPEHHLVFDMGAGSTKATLLRFQARTVKDVGKFNKTIQEVEALATGWDRTLGGDALNAVIVDDMVEQFVAANGAKAPSLTPESVKGHGRASSKLWKEAERVRHVLSANTETQASFEGLYDDIDFRYKLTRTEFEKLSESFTSRVRPPIEAAVDKAGLEIEDLDSIILHGGAVRTPFIQKELEVIIGSPEKLRSNVNADEAAAFGAGFKAAGLSPSFRVKEIKTSEVAGYGVGIKWINLHAKPQHQQLFKSESHIGIEKTFSFKNQKDFDILFYQHVGSAENVTPGSAEKEVLTLTTKNLTSSVAEIKSKGCDNFGILFKLGVRLNPDHGNVDVTHVALHCELEEEEKKDSVVDSVKGLFGFGAKKEDQEVLNESEVIEAIGEGSEGSSSSTTATSSSASAAASLAAKEVKPKTTTRLITIPIEHEIELKGYAELPAAELKRIKARLASFDDSDRSRVLREEALNQLEGFTYRIRDLLDDSTFITASTDAERASLEKKSTAAGDWLYDDGATATREELKVKLKELKDIVTPIEKRRDESAKRPEQVKLLQDALEQTKGFIDSVRNQVDKAASSASSVVDSSTTSASEATTTSGEFEGLEDDETSITTSDSAKATPVPPLYTEEDVAPVQEVYDSVTAWLSIKLAEQDALPETADPILLVKDLAEKADALQKAGMELVMKAMKAQPKSTSKSKTSKTKSSKKPKKTQATSSAKGESVEASAAETDEVSKPEVTDDVGETAAEAQGKDHKIDEL